MLGRGGGEAVTLNELDRCDCGQCRDRRALLYRAEELKRLAMGLECVREAGKRIAREAICGVVKP